MTTSRIISTLSTKLPKYMGRTGAVAASGTGFLTAELIDSLDQTWGSQHRYTTGDSIKNAAGAFLLCSAPGYAVGYASGKGVVKVCEIAAKSGIPQATCKFIKKL